MMPKSPVPSPAEVPGRKKAERERQKTAEERVRWGSLSEVRFRGCRDGRHQAVAISLSSFLECMVAVSDIRTILHPTNPKALKKVRSLSATAPFARSGKRRSWPCSGPWHGFLLAIRVITIAIAPIEYFGESRLGPLVRIVGRTRRRH